MNFSRLCGEEFDEPSSDNCSSSCTVFLAGLFFNGIAEGDMRSAVLLSGDGSSTGTAFLTDFFFEADIRSRHSCTTFLAFFFLEDITVLWYRLKRTDLTTRFVLVLSCKVAPSCHQGSAGAPSAYNRGTTGSYRGITVDNLGSTGPYRHEPGLHRAAP